MTRLVLHHGDCVSVLRSYAEGSVGSWGTALKPAWEPVLIDRRNDTGSAARFFQHVRVGGLSDG
jgi:hypothetical protein